MTIRNELPKEKRLYADDIWKAHYEELSARLDALEANQAPAKPVVDKPWPQDGDEYYLLNSGGGAGANEWDGLSVEMKCLARGNVFRTKEEAEKADQLCLAMNELKVMSEKDWSLECNPLSWDDTSQNKWEAYWDHQGGWWGVEKLVYFQSPFSIYFPTQDSARAAYKAIDAKYEGVLR